MHPNRLALAAGVFVLLAGAGLVMSATPGRDSAQAPSQAAKQAPEAPRFVNAQVETKSPANGLARAVADAAAARHTAAWIGYSVPAVPGKHRMCESDQHPARAYLEGRPRTRPVDDGDGREPEPGGDLAILLRTEGGRTQKVRVFSVDCELDGGGLPVLWLTNVTPAESVAMLHTIIVREDAASDVSDHAALTALALHADPSALRALEGFTAAGQPTALRKRAAFWLGAARGKEGFQALKRLMAGEIDNAFRRELVFPLSLGRTRESTDTLIGLAHDDASPEVRKQAMFWLGTKAGERAAATLAQAAASDPDTGAKKRAVFGLSRMPDGEGVPRLIEVARTNRNPEVRREAMFWLGQSNDPRALAFLEEVLKK